MKKFEYKIITQKSITDDPFTIQINGIGEDGWELVAVISENGKESKTKQRVLFFKKEKK